MHPFAFWSYITWALSVNLVENGHFDHSERIRTVSSTTNIEFSWDAYFWVLQSVRFHMIYNKSYYHQKFKIMISESIGRFFLSGLSSHVTRKRKKEKNNRMPNWNKNIQGEKTKIFHVRFARYVFFADLIIWTISWSYDRCWNKRRK